MNKLFILTALVAATSVAVVAEEVKLAITQSEFDKLTPQQKAERKAKIDEILYKRTGGKLMKDKGKGQIVVVNAQKDVPTAELQKPLADIKHKLHLNMAIREGSLTKALPTGEMVKKAGGEFCIFIVGSDEIETTMLVAPESRWAVVNVSALKKDNPSAAVLANRTRVELSRAFCYLCGGVSSQHDGMVTSAITSLGGLDKFDVYDTVPFDLKPRIAGYVKFYGVRPFEESTYRRACQEGWAPDPQDEVQKKIWDETHEIPKKPLKIEFDPNTGKK